MDGKPNILPNIVELAKNWYSRINGQPLSTERKKWFYSIASH